MIFSIVMKLVEWHHNKINVFVSPGEIPVFISLGHLSTSRSSMLWCQILILPESDSVFGWSRIKLSLKENNDSDPSSNPSSILYRKLPENSQQGLGSGLWCFNATFNNISVISLLSVLLVEETRVPVGNYRPAASHWQTDFDPKDEAFNKKKGCLRNRVCERSFREFMKKNVQSSNENYTCHNKKAFLLPND